MAFKVRTHSGPVFKTFQKNGTKNAQIFHKAKHNEVWNWTAFGNQTIWGTVGGPRKIRFKSLTAMRAISLSFFATCLRDFPVSMKKSVMVSSKSAPPSTAHSRHSSSISPSSEHFNESIKTFVLLQPTRRWESFASSRNFFCENFSKFARRMVTFTWSSVSGKPLEKLPRLSKVMAPWLQLQSRKHHFGNHQFWLNKDYIVWIWNLDI